MTELVWSPQALLDLEGIRAFIALDSPRYADLTVRRVVAAVERLKLFPESGRIVPERKSPDIREVIVGAYRVVLARTKDVRQQLFFTPSRPETPSHEL